jgi:chromosomal replication initiation ATPase DnaA
MKKEEQDVSQLLKSISVGLQKYGISEFNTEIKKIIAKKADQQREINFVINMVSGQYTITPNTLLNSRSRGKIQEARTLAYCLLHLTLGLSIRKIAVIFGRYHNSIASALKSFSEQQPEKFKMDKEFSSLYEKCQDRLLNHIKDDK